MAPARLESAAPAPAAQQKHKYQHQLQQDHNHHHNHHHKPALAAKADLFGGLCLWYIWKDAKLQNAGGHSMWLGLWPTKLPMTWDIEADHFDVVMKPFSLLFFLFQAAVSPHDNNHMLMT